MFFFVVVFFFGGVVTILLSSAHKTLCANVHTRNERRENVRLMDERTLQTEKVVCVKKNAQTSVYVCAPVRQ